MSHSEMYPDGRKITKFIEEDLTINKTLADQFAALSQQAFDNGAEKVEQRVIHGNETCPMCDSGLRFDLCHGQPEQVE